VTIAVKKWGNSLAIRVPKDIAHTLSLDNDSLVELKVEKGVLTIKPTKQVTLVSLVSKISKDNVHEKVDKTGSMDYER